MDQETTLNGEQHHQHGLSNRTCFPDEINDVAADNKSRQEGQMH